MKFGSLKLLENSGPHRACYMTPLPFILTVDVVECNKLFGMRYNTHAFST